MVQRQVQPQGDPKKRYLQRSDAHALRPRFIVGETIEELSAWLAEHRRVPYEQAENFLKRVRAEEGWIEERAAHLTAVESLMLNRDRENRAAAIMNTQDAIGTRLIMRGLEEITTIPATSRSEALRTLKQGYEFRYRAASLPPTVTDPASLPPVGDLAGKAASFQTISDAQFAAEVANRLAAFAPIAGMISAAAQERTQRLPEVVERDDDGDDEAEY
jgi:hypothetical protein